MGEVRRFVVRRIEWVKNEYSGSPYFRRTPRAEPVADYKTFDAAEFDRRRREAETRANVNPFLYGGEALFYQTSFDAPRLHDWLLDAAVEPPVSPNAHSAWVTWWNAFAHTWSDEQRLRAWLALDKVRFFEVVETQPSRKAYAVIEVNWTWQDEPTLHADYEGGNVIRAYRRKADAQHECDRLNRERQRQTEYAGYSFFTRHTRAGEERAHSQGMEDTVFFEVVEIDLGEGA